MNRVILGGQEYEVVFNFKVLKTICKELKMTAPQVIAGIQNIDLDITGEMLFQGIRVKDEEFSREVIDNLGIIEFFNIFEKIGEILTETMPEEGKKKSTKKK